MSLVVTDATRDGERIGIRCEGGTIAQIGADVAARDGDDVLDASGCEVIPGLVNGHTHAAMTLFRGYADDLPLMEWLEQHIWPIEARLEPEDVYWGTRLACAEMIRTGTQRFWDMYWHPEAAARAVEDAGLRSVVAAPLIDGPDPAEARARALEAIDAVADSPSGRVSVGFAPHAIYTVGPESLEWVSAEAKRRETTIQIHLSETRQEVDDCVAAHGMRPAEVLDRAGMLGPSTILAHGVWLNEAELGLIAERGATVVTNPVANMKLAVGGLFPYPHARDAGVAMGIGTDGPGSNNSLDLLSDLKTFALMQKNGAEDAAVVTASESLALARGELSELTAADSLVAGAPADFLLVREDSLELSMGALDAGLAYASSGSVVDTSVVAGKVLMRGGVVEGTGEIVARARECAERLGMR